MHCTFHLSSCLHGWEGGLGLCGVEGRGLQVVGGRVEIVWGRGEGFAGDGREG